MMRSGERSARRSPTPICRPVHSPGDDHDTPWPSAQHGRVLFRSPATMTECQTAAGSSSPVCDSGAPQRLTTYQYGANGTANNLLVRGVTVSADGVMLRTCYGYDALGRKISETKPNANLSTCP